MSLTATCLLFLSIFLLPSVYSLREQCCKDLGVPEKCYEHLCNPTVVPKVMKRYRLWDPQNYCQDYLPAISKCIAKGRDVSSCCYKKADDLDFTFCFGLCNGTMGYSYERRNDYLSCFVLNVVSMFPCLVEGYSTAPSQPRDLKIVSHTEINVDLEWSEPAELPELVRKYKVHLTERVNMQEVETVYETKEMKFTLEDLSPDSAYSVYVVACGPENNGDDEWNKSMVSNIVPFTTDDEIALSAEDIRLPPTAKYIELPCLLRRIMGSEGEVDWVKVSKESSELLPNGTKYSIFTYPSDLDPNTIVSAVKILNFTSSDFGVYRCYIKDQRIEYNEVTIMKYIYSEEAPNENPPETLLECCSKGDHDPGCTSVCNGHGLEGGGRAQLRPGNYLPSTGCPKEVDRLFKCSIADSGVAGCCIHSQIPFHCLGMCDSRFEMSMFKQKTCRKPMREVYKCQFALMDWKPEAVSFVKVKHLQGDTYRFSWDIALDVKVFHIYYRKNRGKWTSRVTIDYVVDINDADEVVLISVNDFGRSQQHRLSLDDNGWFTVDHW